MLCKGILVLALASVCYASGTPSHAFIIALDAAWGEQLAARISRHLSLQSVHVIVANNGTTASLPLYTRHLIAHGRHEHIQIGNRAMVGCLLSHVEAWRRVSSWAYVFEEDALVEEGALQSVSQLLQEVMWVNFSVLMLQARRFEAAGVVHKTGPLAATCDSCTWFGTRGYIVTEQGARVLLEYVEPVVVQVDALMGLVNEFDPRFHLFWTQTEIVGNARPLASTVWDGCVLACFGVAVQIACLVSVVVLCAVMTHCI